MADGFDTTTQSERVAFCQDCGKPLTPETMRQVGSGVFCEPCLVQRVGSGTVPPPPPTGGTYAGGFGTAIPPVGSIPAHPDSLPNPTAAGWLAVLPGAGAVYNGQYAKGLVIFIIVMVLSELKDVTQIFGLAACVVWVFQIIDAHHTAKARILGTPLPNPFGLNDIGDRLGFGKNWPGSMYHHAAGDPSAPPAPPATPAATPGAVPVPPVPPATWSGYVHPGNFAQSAQSTGTAWANSPYQAPPTTVPYAPVESTSIPFAAPPQPTPHRGFPVAALVLIVLGLIALSDSVLHFQIDGSWIPALVLGVFGLWSLTHRLQQAHRNHPEGVDSATLTSCIFREPAIIMIVLAVLFALQAANIFTFGQTWPVLVIVVGLQLLIHRAVERSAYLPGVNAPYTPPYSAPYATTEAPRADVENGGRQ